MRKLINSIKLFEEANVTKCTVSIESDSITLVYKNRTISQMTIKEFDSSQDLLDYLQNHKICTNG